jgi:hypothetical protein
MPRGSKPGEHRGGRVKGTPNKATAEIKDIARPYGPDCIEKLWAIASSSESDPAKVAAIKEILDRGYGKPKDNGGEPQKHEHTICVTGVPRHGDQDA